MAKIKIDVAGRPLLEKLNKGQLVIAKGTNNPDAPGNAALLAEFIEVQAELKAAAAAAEAARQTSIQRTAEQATVEKKWRARLNALASFTEAVTGGDAVKILGAGFDVRATATPTPVPEAVGAVIVKLNGTPGHSKLTWEPLPEADGYLVQGSPDLSSEENWVAAGLTTKASMAANGASPGQHYWYRVAAFNSAGLGPWSEPGVAPGDVAAEQPRLISRQARPPVSEAMFRLEKAERPGCPALVSIPNTRLNRSLRTHPAMMLSKVSGLCTAIALSCMFAFHAGADTPVLGRAVVESVFQGGSDGWKGMNDAALRNRAGQAARRSDSDQTRPERSAGREDRPRPGLADGRLHLAGGAGRRRAHALFHLA